MFWDTEFSLQNLYLNVNQFRLKDDLKMLDKQNSTIALMRDVRLRIKMVIYVGQKQFLSLT